MAAANYNAAINRVLKSEGGYVDHPNDPGGPTNFGITLAVYRANGHPDATAADVKAMELAEAKRIYRAKYAAPVHFDEHAYGVDYALLDYAVHSGPGRANKVLRRCCGLADNAPWSQAFEAAARRNPEKLTRAINAERIAFLQTLSTWGTFGKGWTARMNAVNAAAVQMAIGGSAPLVADPPLSNGKGQVQKPNTAGGVAGGGAAAATGGAFGFGDWIAAHPMLSAAIFAALFVVAALVAERLARRWRDVRQDAVVPFTVVPET